MVVQHNLAAMNANRMFLNNDRKKAKVTEKLSSGYRINRAADDAAGLAISEKMRRQIRGLTQAAKNAQDGISMVQIADGAMAEVHEMLHRGTELSIKAANGTLTDEDRSYIQREIEQLKSEIDGIAERTNFNEIQVLKGKDFPIEEGTSNVIISGGMPSWVTLGSTSNMSETYITKEKYRKTDTNGIISEVELDIKHEAATIDFSGFDGTPAKINELVGNGFHTTCCTCTNHYSIKFTAKSTSDMEVSGQHYIYNIGIAGVNDAGELMNRIIQGTNNGNPRGHYTKITADSTNNKLIIYDDRSKEALPSEAVGGNWVGWNNYYSSNIKAHGEYGKFGPGAAYSVDDAGKLRNPATVALQIGAEAGQHLGVELPSISCKTLGISGIDVSTISGADAGITAFKKAVAYVSGERSRMGAYQNRLEHTIKNLDNVVENTQAAESAIRDADMAKLMVEYSNSNIIAQAGQAMMAQANQSNQGVLQLLG